MMASATALFSCEKNDPLAELGTVVGEHKVPFVTLSGVQALYPAGATIEYNVLYWTINDDIQKLVLMRNEMVSLTGTFKVDDGGGEITVPISTIIETEMAQFGDDLAHDPLNYETARNAYNKAMQYPIPAAYQQLKIKDGELDKLATFNELAYAAELKQAILEALAANGVSTSWEDLPAIITAIDLTAESVLNFQMRVYNANGFNDSPIRSVKIGALEE